MPTPAAKIEVNRERVIQSATELFWRKGYDGVSVGDLVEATGLNRYALYQTFGGKREIFLAILHSYAEESHQSVGEILSRDDVCPYDNLFDCIHDKMLDPEIFPAGCLMCTTAVDVAAKDEEVASIMEDVTAKIAVTFGDAFLRAQQNGLASKDRDPEAFAELAHALYFSTGVQARMGRGRQDLIDALRKTLDALKQ